MKWSLRTLLSLAVGLAGCAQAGYLDEWASMKSLVPRGYVCFRATNSIVADGRLSEPTWQAAPWTLEFLPITGQTNALANVRVRAKFLWDSANLYWASELQAFAPQARLDKTGGTADLSPEWRLVLDADGDGHNYCELAFGADATVRLWRYDKPPKDGGSPLPLSQSGGTQVRARLDPAASAVPQPLSVWTIEGAIPWRDLATSAGALLPDDREQWRLNIGCAVKPGLAARHNGLAAAGLLWVWSPHGVADLHRPERWGYLQFSRKRGTRAPFIPDPGLAARNALQGLYYAQKDFYARHGRWAVSLAELGYSFEPEPGLDRAPVIRLTAEGFEASIDGPVQGLRPLRWHISHDGRFWADAELRLQIQRYYRTVADPLAEP